MNKSRREFLSLCLKGGMSAAALTSLQLQALSGSVEQRSFSDYKALVCVYLYGGNDSMNMLVPLSGEQRSWYEASRQNLAVQEAISLSTASEFEGGVGLHPAMAPLQSYFDQQNLAFVGGVGTLIAPTSLTEYQAKSVPLPQHLFSHNDQQATWMHGQEKQTLNTGWGARLLERLEQGSVFGSNITIDGANPWQTGTNSSAFALSKSGVSKINALSGYEPRVEHVRRVMQTLFSQASHPLASAYASRLSGSIEHTLYMNTLLEQAPTLTTEFGESSLSAQLAAVAKTISIQSQLGAQRQIFFVSMGGFDTHDNQESTHPALLGALANSLGEFQNALTELGVADQVSTFTMSDFGRTLTSNGDGTDHGWAGNQLVLGGAVKGGDLHGAMMAQRLDGPDDVGGGRLIPAYSNEQYFAPLARWFGLGESELTDLFPNLSNFDAQALSLFKA
ncbi:DUF1501 domain-containing protein [Pseudoalteromonas sp. DL2-H2.2]|uniref:DUF1501 domain-containing protein n=1 Tax=Pseudoalteromonas sp. DL2-H2.2 TaxID=2908889 RepID=UPI001F1A4A44|nr:DUF1501 domain-containing protein [Pseudoalteromonas sp. DL2-H2.2]MCF2909140.1 DUF1501 domain-containing protein [Pseudoalteromonas sp. DL2-H2.2]